MPTVYFTDTDSIIYQIPTNTVDPLEPFVGDYLGMLTSELSHDETMTEFVTVGPKTYGFQKVCTCKMEPTDFDRKTHKDCNR